MRRSVAPQTDDSWYHMPGTPESEPVTSHNTGEECAADGRPGPGLGLGLHRMNMHLHFSRPQKLFWAEPVNQPLLQERGVEFMFLKAL